MASRTITVSNRGTLPHWQTEEGTYFVTFRLFDSLPGFLARTRGVKRIEEELDRGFGSAHLARKDIGEMVFGALRYFDGDRYTLHTASVMPNHVHSVLRTKPETSITSVLRSLKSFTGRRANRLLGRQGIFWQRESYDHLIRDGNEFNRANEYVLANPEKAGLRSWEWVGAFDRTFVARYVEEQDGREQCTTESR